MASVASGVKKSLLCTHCRKQYSSTAMLFGCGECSGQLKYVVEGTYDAGRFAARSDQWRHFELLPLQDPNNIVSLNEGGSALIGLDDLDPQMGGARLWLKLDAVKNPTGTFKDREASLVISRCKELGYDNLVYYSTGNTGRAYTHYAASQGLTTYFFLPRECEYKVTASMRRGPRNYVIAIDSEYPNVAPYAKRFATENGLTLVAPLHDRTEAYATLAYEQVQELPDCDFFAQTIASGMGPIGFLRGHQHLVDVNIEERRKIPRIVCIQSSQTNAMSAAYRAGKERLMPEDLPTTFTKGLFEPTLNSTNPVNNYPELRACLDSSNGIITDVDPAFVEHESGPFMRALERRGIHLRYELEKSCLIGYAGLVRLAMEGTFGDGDRVLLLATGRGGQEREARVDPDLVVRPSVDAPADVFAKLADIGSARQS